MKWIKIFEDFQSIEKWKIDKICRNYAITNCTVNSDGTVDVDDDVNLAYLAYEENKLPLTFGRVTDSFWCHNSNLTSLVGAPKFVGKTFQCSENELTSLEGGPQEVNNFYCNHTNITSLKGSPLIVKNDFFAMWNTRLISFEGFPNIGGNFNCNGCPIENIWKLFKDPTKIELFNEYDIIRGNDLILDRLNDFLITIGEEPVESVNGYNNI